MKAAGTAAVVLAAGAGRRMSAPIKKVFLPVGGETILARTLSLFESLPSITTIVLVGAEADLAHCRELVSRHGFTKVKHLVTGGPSRHESEASGIFALDAQIQAGEIDLILVHDAVRPFLAPEDVEHVIEEARRSGAAILAVPSEGTLVSEAEGWLGETELQLWAAQTPQAFQSRLVLDAHRRAEADGFIGTDTSSVVERTGHPVKVVAGSSTNFKITTSDDLLRAELIADQIGHPEPWLVHRSAEGGGHG